MQKGTAQIKRTLKLIRSKWIYMALAGVLFSSFCSGLTYFLNPPVYVAEVTVYINNSSELRPGVQKNVTTVDLLVSEILVPTYVAMLRSNTALGDTLSRSAVLEYTIDELRDAISVETVPGTALVKLSVMDKNSENAIVLANSLIDTLNEVVAEHIEGSSVGVIDKANSSSRLMPSGFGETLFLSFLTGFSACFIFMYISERKRAYVSSPDDLKKLFELPLLGVVPCINYTQNNENVQK